MSDTMPYLPDVTAFLRDLIRIPSYSGQEEDVVRRILAEMTRLGVYDRVYHDSLGNAVGIWGHGPVTVMLDGHVDVVDAGDELAWPYPPFAAVEKEGMIHGRGATDEKPGIACMTYAPRLLDSSLKDDVTVIVVGSVLEEDCDGYPLTHIIEEEGVRPDVVIIGEPTNLNVYRGQRGRMELTIDVSGVSAHGAHCDRGDNAIYRMASVIGDIEALNAQLPVRPLLGKGSVTISKIESHSPSLCSVADGCRIYLDRRLTTGETIESVLDELNALPSVRENGASVRIREYHGVSWTGMECTQECYFPTWVLDDTHPLVECGLAAAAKVCPAPPELGVWTFSTNGVSTMGRYGIPTIGFAPGREELAHSVDEKTAIVELPIAAEFYAACISEIAARGIDR